MVHPSHLAAQFVRGFDALCVILGLALLIALAPTLLILSAHASGPAASQLVRIEGKLTSCRSDSDGSTFTLSGQPDSYRSVTGPPETCADALADTEQGLSVAVYVVPADQRASHSTAAIPTYGMTVDGTVLRSANQDMQIGRIDAAVFLLLALGSAGTLFAVVRTTRRVRKPFSYLLADADAPNCGSQPYPGAK
jgi:hypothetical protein